MSNKRAAIYTIHAILKVNLCNAKTFILKTPTHDSRSKKTRAEVFDFIVNEVQLMIQKKGAFNILMENISV